MCHDLSARHSVARPAPSLTAAMALQWLAYHLASGETVGLGFRPAGTGLVCIDMDDCVTAEGWSPGALAVMGRLPGALIEQSTSGTGLHLWCTVQGDGPGRRGRVETPYGAMECYGEGQFIALGTVLGGDALTDHTSAVGALVTEYWPAVPDGGELAPLTDWATRTPEQRAATLADLSAALRVLDADNRDEWVAVGQALASLGDEGYKLWAEWSARSSRFPGGDGLDKWDSFTALRTDYRAVLAKAQRAGWVNPAARAEIDVATAFAPNFIASEALPAGLLLDRPASNPVSTELSFMAAAGGAIASTVASIETALLSPEAGVKIGYDTFKDRVSISVAGEPWRPLRDTDYGRMRAAFERRGFKPVPAEAMSTAVAMVAESNTFDSAIEWANALPAWDGVARVDLLLPVFYGTPDTPYTRAVGAYLFTALAGRLLVPGIKADMAVIFVGLQGAQKTSSIEVLCPEPEAFGEVDLNTRDADLARSMRGKLIMEMAELNGLAGRDQEAIKAWISRRREEWTPKYKEMAVSYLRRFVLIGTDNRGEFLDDPTGARRFLPTRVGRVDIPGLAAARDQLWAEGVARFRAGGIAWQVAEELARAEHHKFEVVDELLSVVQAWLDQVPPFKLGEPIATEPRSAGVVRGVDILTGALNTPFSQIKKNDEMRLAKIMRRLNYERGYLWENDRNIRVWKKLHKII
jgi:hypothetical protein